MIVFQSIITEKTKIHIKIEKYISYLARYKKQITKHQQTQTWITHVMSHIFVVFRMERVFSVAKIPIK